MAKNTPPPTLLDSPDQVETAFYEALQTGDVARLMACFADEPDVYCIHPSGGRLVGQAAIAQAFEQLFNANAAAENKQKGLALRVGHIHRVNNWGGNSGSGAASSSGSATASASASSPSNGCAVHSVVEYITLNTQDGSHMGVLIATNVYAHTARGWRMLAHHTSPAFAFDEGSEGAPNEAAGRVLH